MSEVAVSRAINGISLNGDEYLLDEDGGTLVFADEATAREFLRFNGLPQEEIDNCNFVPIDELPEPKTDIM